MSLFRDSVVELARAPGGEDLSNSRDKKQLCHLQIKGRVHRKKTNVGKIWRDTDWDDVGDAQQQESRQAQRRGLEFEVVSVCAWFSFFGDVGFFTLFGFSRSHFSVGG